MSRRSTLMIFLFALFSALMSGQAFADPDACQKCHSADEFEGLTPAFVQEALADPGLPPHRGFADLTIEEITALLEELAE